jgi:hypothetical protein
MSAKETAYATGAVNVAHSSSNAEPATGVFLKLRIRGLKEDFDAVEGPNDGLGLTSKACQSLSGFK